MIQIDSFDYDFSVLISKFLISTPNVSGELQTHLFNSLFVFPHRPSPWGLVEVDFTPFSMQCSVYHCYMGAGGRNKTLFSNKGPYCSQHSKQHERSLLTPVSLYQVPQNGGPDNMPLMRWSEGH